MKLVRGKPFSFADDLNRLELAYRVLESALYAEYSADVKMIFEHEESACKPATVEVEATSKLSWGRQASDGMIVTDWRASGTIRWFTTSGHNVKFEFTRAQDGPIELERVLVGSDPSENLYPSITEFCEELGVEVGVEVEETEVEVSLTSKR